MHVLTRISSRSDRCHVQAISMTSTTTHPIGHQSLHLLVSVIENHYQASSIFPLRNNATIKNWVYVDSESEQIPPTNPISLQVLIGDSTPKSLKLQGSIFIDINTNPSRIRGNVEFHLHSLCSSVESDYHYLL